MIIKRYGSDILNKESSRKLDKAVLCTVIPILVIMLAVVFLLLSETIKLNKTSDLNASDVNASIITELNKTYTGDLIITATDIKVIDNPDEEDSENIIVGVRFEITNNSNIDYYPSNYIDAYIDDVKVSGLHSELFNRYNENLYQRDVAPGKKVMGYVTATATRDSKKVEILFEEPSYYTGAKIISFVFDIPPV